LYFRTAPSRWIAVTKMRFYNGLIPEFVNLRNLQPVPTLPPTDNADPEKRVLATVFEVIRRTDHTAGGSPIVRDIVVHPGAVVILPVLGDGSIVMIRNHRRAVGEELLELPAGTLEPPERPAAAAARELEEETGYVSSTIEPFLQFFSTPGFCTERIHCFVATNLTRTHQRLRPGEEIRVEIVGQQRARECICDGSIRDGKTIAALGAYFLRREF